MEQHGAADVERWTLDRLIRKPICDSKASAGEELLLNNGNDMCGEWSRALTQWQNASLQCVTSQDEITL